MKTPVKLILFLALISSFSCTEVRKNRDTELYENTAQNRIYDSSTGKPFTGIGVKEGTSEYATTIEIKYEDGYIEEMKFIDSRGKTSIYYKYDEEGNPVGLIYYDYDGNPVTSDEFHKLRQE